MGDYLIPILIFCGLGLLSGILLTIGSKVFAVEVDERVDQVKEALPGVNCGACGFSGCEDYANAIIESGVATNMCKPGGDAVSAKISGILGTAVLDVTETVAFVKCRGNCNATSDKFTYEGTETCLAANRFYSGKGKCKSACLGYGDCVAVCEYGAICIRDGIAVVDPRKCVGCGMCAAKCPNKLIVIKDATKRVEVACSSVDTGKVTRQNCLSGCIACKLCEKKCAFGAIKVEGNRAVIDYSLCTVCGECAQVCPSKCIIQIPN